MSELESTDWKAGGVNDHQPLTPTSFHPYITLDPDFIFVAVYINSIFKMTSP